jgi:hypothetical protein
MRSARNFHPEWGYLAPSPNFIRTARIVLIAVAVGGIAGASVVLSLAERPTSEASVAARTLQRPAEFASVPADNPQAAQVKTQAAMQDQPTKRTPIGESQAASQSSTSSTTQPSTSATAEAEAPAAGAASPAKAASYQAPAAHKSPLQKNATRKPRPTSRYASRGEHVNGYRGPRRPFEDQSLFGANVPAEYYPRRGYGGYYREQRWGDYYPDGRFDYR